MSDIEGKAAREAASECGQGASFKNLQQCRYATLHLQKTVSASGASEPALSLSNRSAAIETRSLPALLAPTLVALPSISAIPFLDSWFPDFLI